LPSTTARRSPASFIHRSFSVTVLATAGFHLQAGAQFTFASILVLCFYVAAAYPQNPY